MISRPGESRDPLFSGSGRWRLWFQAVIEIGPVRVIALDQLDFPRAFPFFDLSLALCRSGHGFMRFVPHQPIDTVLRCEAMHRFRFVLPNSADQVGGAWLRSEVRCRSAG